MRRVKWVRGVEDQDTMKSQMGSKDKDREDVEGGKEEDMRNRVRDGFIKTETKLSLTKVWKLFGGEKCLKQSFMLTGTRIADITHTLGSGQSE